MPYYSVIRGIKDNIIYNNWEDCKKNIENIENALYKKFDILKDAEDFIANNKNIYVYTDGSCINNGKINAKAGIGIYFGKNDNRNVSKRIDGKQTNNTAELKAIIETLKILHKEINNNLNIFIITDSEYAIKCCTTYGYKLNKSNWKLKDDKPIPNLNLIKELYNITSNYPNIKFKHIMAHTNNDDIHSIGNYNADLLAKIAIDDINKTSVVNKIYLNVPYVNKDEAKVLGAKWDKNCKKWYIYENNKNKERLLQLFS